MKTFREFVIENSATPSTSRTHMTHISDSIIDGGVEGTHQAINYLRFIRDMLAGNADSPVNISVKWDGAPAVFAGVDPSDGKFFVAKKGIFNKSPKVYKTNADIDADTSGNLNSKLKLALAEFPKLGIKDVIQGDFLYAREDIKEVDIDGEPHITFHPNTIVYAVPKKSKLAKQILGSKIGVVWHTRYRGESFETMSASFGEEIASGLKKPKEIWSVDAVFKDVSGSATMTNAETAEITELLSKAEKLFSSMEKSLIDGLSDNKDLKSRINTFINMKVKNSQKIGEPKQFVKDLITYIEDYYQKEADKKKTEKGKQASFYKRDEVLSHFKKHDDVAAVFKLYNYVDQAKDMIISKLNKVQNLKTFLKTSDGYEVTGQEGFVAVDHMGKNALKLVDRLNFSKANFSAAYIKGWQR